jgi:hypothetical protein
LAILFPPGTTISLDTSVLSFKANRNHIASYNDGDFSFSARMLKHEFEMFWLTHDIEVFDFLACFSKGLPG